MVDLKVEVMVYHTCWVSDCVCGVLSDVLRQFCGCFEVQSWPSQDDSDVDVEISFYHCLGFFQHYS